MNFKTKFFALSVAIVFNAAFNVSAVETKPLKGSVVMDGSSTVFPISEAVGEEFQKTNKNVKVAVAVSGTGGGFKKFCKGELDLTGASRPIEAQEIEACATAKIDYIELPVAYDGIAIVVNKKNDWAKNLTVAELKSIWDSGSKITNWKDVRPGFPDVKLSLFGPGHDSGSITESLPKVG
jgi:phosphate transport system substrate-binding protein